MRLRRKGRYIEVSKWFYFQELAPNHKSRKTKIWSLRTIKGNNPYGRISWSSDCSKYCFYPYMKTVFDEQCLRRIANFCKTQTEIHKTKGAYHEKDCKVTTL